MREILDDDGRVVLQKPQSSSIYCSYTGRHITRDMYGITFRMRRYRTDDQYTINWISISGLSSLIPEMEALMDKDIEFSDYPYNTMTIQNGVCLSEPEGTRYTCVCCGERIIDSREREAYYFADQDLNNKVFIHNRYGCIRQLKDCLDNIRARSEKILPEII